MANYYLNEGFLPILHKLEKNFDKEDIVPHRSAARSVNREVMIYRERLAAQMSSAKKQTVSTSPRTKRNNNYYSDDLSSDELSTFSENEGSVSESVFSSPESSPQVLNSKSNYRSIITSPARKPVITTTTTRSLDNLDIELVDEDEDEFELEDEDFFEELTDARVCKIDAVILISKIHSMTDTKRPLLFIKV